MVTSELFADGHAEPHRRTMLYNSLLVSFLQKKTPHRTRSESRGFTLIELLTVIAIIGILAAILIPSLQSVRMNAYKADTASDLRQIHAAVGLYAASNGGDLPGPSYSGVSAGFRATDKSLTRYLAPYLSTTPGEGIYSTVEEFLPTTFPDLSGNYNEQNKGPAFLINQDMFTEETFVEPFGYPPAGNRERRDPKKLFMVPDPAQNVLLYGLDVVNINGTPGWISSIAQSPLFGSERPFLYWDGHVEISTRKLPLGEID